MNTVPSDPLAALVHLRIEDLRREASDYALARKALAGRRHRRWPSSVAASLRESLAHASATRPAAITDRRRGEPCPTC